MGGQSTGRAGDKAHHSKSFKPLWFCAQVYYSNDGKDHHLPLPRNSLAHCACGDCRHRRGACFSLFSSRGPAELSVSLDPSFDLRTADVRVHSGGRLPPAARARALRCDAARGGDLRVCACRSTRPQSTRLSCALAAVCAPGPPGRRSVCAATFFDNSLTRSIHARSHSHSQITPPTSRQLLTPTRRRLLSPREPVPPAEIMDLATLSEEEEEEAEVS